MTDQDIQQLRSLVPLHTLSEEGFSELTADIRVEAANRGQTLFREGDTDNENIYLLDGQLALKANNRVVEQVSAGSDTARFPIGHQLPRKYTAQATSGARFVRIETRRLSEFLAREHTVDYQVNDLDDDSANDDWMTQLLQSRVMQQIPASNIQSVMMKVEQLDVTAGEIVIREGEPGDYYYMLSRGKAVVSRDSGDGGPPSELARLGPGTSFGEEALLANSPRNSTITMLTNGILLRLKKQDFVELIHLPLVARHEFAQAIELVDQGAVWLDVRATEAFESGQLPGSLNLPFNTLRYQVSNLVADSHYILVSDNSDVAAAAAFLLTERGFDVSVLEGGYDVAQQRMTDAQNEIQLADGSQQDATASMADSGFESGGAARGRSSVQRIDGLATEQVNAGVERQASLHHLKDALEKARRRMLALEQERKAATKERDQARADAEQAAGKLQEAELEREGMRQRLVDFEQKDQVWQERLRRAEAHGIGERDKAESASQRLEHLETQLKAAREDQQETREAHARQTGELKEELTGLQLDLEQAHSDHEELQAVAEERQAELASAKQQSADFEQTVKELERRCEQATADAESLAKRLEELRETAGDAAREQLAVQLKAMEQQASDQAQVLAERERGLDQARKELEAATERNRQTEAELQEAQTLAGEQLQVQATLEQRLAELEEQRSEAVAHGQELSGQLQTTKYELERLEATCSTLEETKTGLEHELTDRQEAIASREAEQQRLLTEAGASSTALQAEKQELLKTLQAREQELTETRDRVIAQEAAKRVFDAELAAQKAEYQALEGQVQDLRAAASANTDKLADAERVAALERDQTNVKLADLSRELEAITQAKAVSEAELAAKDQEIEQLRTDLQAARQRHDETSVRLQDATQHYGENQRSLKADLEAAQAALAESQRAAQANTADKETELQGLRQALSVAEQTQQATDSELDAQRAELQQLRTVSEEYQARLRDTEQVLTQQHSESIDALSAKLQASEATLAQKAADLAAREQDRDALAAELQSTRTAMIELETRQREWDASLGQAKALAEQRRHEVSALQQENAELRGSLDAADHAKQELTAELQDAATALEAQQTDAVQELSELQRRLTQVEAAHQEAVTQRERLASELATAKKQLDPQLKLQDHANVLAQQLQQAIAAREEAERSLAALQQGSSDEAAKLEVIQRQLDDARRDAEVNQQAVVDLEQTLEDKRAEHVAELARRDAEGQALVDKMNALQSRALDASAAARKDEGAQWQQRFQALQKKHAALAEERDAARTKVQELRAVIEQYADQIKAVREASPDKLAALRTELTMVRDQAAQDVQQMQEELDKARARIGELERSSGGHDPLSAEALRQEVSSLKDALAERQRELSLADQNRQQIEDQLEDAAREIERLKREGAIGMSQIIEDRSPSLPNSAFHASEQVADPADVIDELLENSLRDNRIAPPKRTVDMAEVTGANRAGQIALGVLVGLILVLGGLELALYLSGRGELFSQLFGGG